MTYPDREILLDQLQNVDKNWDFVSKSIEIARIAHEGQIRISGKPYFTHLEEVANAFDDYSDKEKATCWLHDAPQKTALTLEDLITFQMPSDVTEAVEVLTPEWGIPYFDEIEKIVKVSLARRPKIGDNMSNMDRDRMPKNYEPSPKIIDNWEVQYPLSIAFIQAVIDEKISENATILDFIKTDHFPQDLKADPRWKHMTSHTQ